MTEIGEIREIDDIMEERVEAEQEAEKPIEGFEKFLKPAQADALKEARFVDKKSIRAASDEDLVKVNGIGAVAVVKLREWAVPEELKEGDAISLRCLVFADEDGFPVNILPGDIIPAKFDAARCVEKGQAVWSQ